MAEDSRKVTLSVLTLAWSCGYSSSSKMWNDVDAFFNAIVGVPMLEDTVQGFFLWIVGVVAERKERIR